MSEVVKFSDISKAIEEAKADHANSYLRIGAILQHVRDQKLWKETHQSFAAFVTEHGFSRSWAYQSIGIVERFGEKAKNILPSRLQAMLPIKTETSDDEENLLIQARDYTAEQFHNVVVERTGKGRATDTCPHSETGTYCTACNKHLT